MLTLDSAKIIKPYQEERLTLNSDVTLYAALRTLKTDIYTAFANQYSLMYRNYVTNNIRYYIPLSVVVANADLLQERNVLVKVWISNFTDTSFTTRIINKHSYTYFAPNITFIPESYLSLNVAQKAQVNIQVFEISEEKQTLFYSQTKEITIHPPQINGAEGIDVINRDSWYSVWVTPGMDSITALHTELSQKLPKGSVKAYQLYAGDTSMAQSSRRLVSAVFDVIKEKGIVYVNNPNAGGTLQKIKYPVEVLRTKQANCIEAVALFASILESLDMETYIFILPEHAILGYRPIKNSNSIEFIETTLALGKEASAIDAIKKGNERFIEQQDLENFNTRKARLVDITAARIIGILPNDIP